MIAEANAMLTGRAELVDIEDEVGTGTLAFVLQSWRAVGPDLDGSGRTSGMGGAGAALRRGARSRVEPEDPDVLEDLVIELLGSGRSSTDG